jgi:hypothetical protein
MTLTDARRLVSELLRDDGELARRKVFSRRHVIVALAPQLYGQDPAFLDPLVDRAIADPEVVPLVGVKGARERVHSLASVLARETAIAESLRRQLARSDAPAVTEAALGAAIVAAEADLGAQLSEEQRSAVLAICTSGRGAELVEGVAGAGKTTMLKVVAAAFAEAGCEVIGTATSGQATRNLSSEADIGESRTLASLIWRLDHHQLALVERTVVILDEVGMTDDVDLVRLAAHVEAAGAKLILLGDHRQIGPVGPGGALGALVSRHPSAVHHLLENRRQHDPDERKALAALRDGEVAEAISFYVGHDRIHAKGDRVDALQAAVDAWAADVTAGHRTGLYAWRRANVAELNALARSWMGSTGRLSGAELVCPGGTAYRAGDEVVALAPGPGGTLVTSERAVVLAVEPNIGAIDLRTSDGREVRLSGEQAGSDCLGHGYATTVHRSQGSTVARAHVFADGGGRELAYVAMSRARESTHAWVVADDLGQAAEDLRRDWSSERTPTWAIDTGLPASDQLTKEAVADLAEEEKMRIAAVAHAETKFAARALTATGPLEVAPSLAEARNALRRTEQARADLAAAGGDYQHTDAGRAVAELASAHVARTVAQQAAENSQGWRDRRSSAKHLDGCIQREAAAQEGWETHVAPEMARLDILVAGQKVTLEQLTGCHERQEATARQLFEESCSLQRSASRLGAILEEHRNDLYGILRPAVSQRTPVRLRQPPVTSSIATPERPETPTPGPQL